MICVLFIGRTAKFAWQERLLISKPGEVIWEEPTWTCQDTCKLNIVSLHCKNTGLVDGGDAMDVLARIYESLDIPSHGTNKTGSKWKPIVPSQLKKSAPKSSPQRLPGKLEGCIKRPSLGVCPGLASVQCLHQQSAQWIKRLLLLNLHRTWGW